MCMCVWCVYIYAFKCTNRQTENNTQLYPDIPDLSPRCCLKTLTCNSSYLKKIQPKALKAGGWYCMVTFLLCRCVPSPLWLQIHQAIPFFNYVYAMLQNLIDQVRWQSVHVHWINATLENCDSEWSAVGEVFCLLSTKVSHYGVNCWFLQADL